MTDIVFLRYSIDIQTEKSINNSILGTQIGCKDTTFFHTGKIFFYIRQKIFHYHQSGK